MKIREQNKWVCKIFSGWAQYRLQSVRVEEEEKQYVLVEDFCKMTVRDMNFWLAKVCAGGSSKRWGTIIILLKHCIKFVAGFCVC